MKKAGTSKRRAAIYKTPNMIRPIHPLRATLLAALLCGMSSVSLLAQGPGGGPEHPHHGPPPSPLFDALDANHDGVISADEIANAPASLKALLKNGATDLKREDLRPTPPRPGPGDESEAGENDHPRSNVPLIRPHGPPPQAAPEHGDPDASPAMGADAVQPDPQADRPTHRHPPAPEDFARPDEREGGPEQRPHHGPPSNPLFDALDANHDGVISAEEMNHASASIKNMLKPGSSELRREDLRPERRERPAHRPEDQ